MTNWIDPRSWGVSPGYHDVAGRWHESPQPTLDAVLAAMGAGPEGPPPPALVTVRTDHPLPSIGPGRVVFEDGAEVDVEGPLPAGMPPGYHLFRPREGSEHQLVVSPGRVPIPAAPGWGFAAQLYATRSKRSWGIGDLADLRELGRWARGLGAGFTLVSPLHASAPTIPQEPSPYYPGSRCFMSPLYIAVDELPGAPDGAAGRALCHDRRIDRDRVWALKSEALEAVFARFGGDAGFDRYRSMRGRPLALFAAFCALAERHGSRWRDWPGEYRHPSKPAVTAMLGSPRVRYYQWLQWILDRQLAAAAGSLGVVVDLAVGVDPSGPDSWIWQDAFASGVRVGAPPDEFNTLGQDWALPVFDPWRLRSGGYQPWIEVLRSGLAHGVGLRVDHVMGLFRLYWIPEGGDARGGAYVYYPHHDLLNILALEAHRAGAWVVGEDLGTVEDEVRRDLGERQVLSYRVWWFEDLPPGLWDGASMGAVTTHDLPTVAGVWTGSDLEAQRRIGTEPNEASSAALIHKIVDRTGVAPGADPEDVVDRVYADLSQAGCVLLTASLEDVLTVEERPNMPGTTDAWPNWSVALPAPLEDLERAPLAARIAGHLNRA